MRWDHRNPEIITVLWDSMAFWTEWIFPLSRCWAAAAISDTARGPWWLMYYVQHAQKKTSQAHRIWKTVATGSKIQTPSLCCVILTDSSCRFLSFILVVAWDVWYLAIWCLRQTLTRYSMYQTYLYLQINRFWTSLRWLMAGVIILMTFTGQVIAV